MIFADNAPHTTQCFWRTALQDFVFAALAIKFQQEPLVLTRYYDPDERDSDDVYASSRATNTLNEPWVESDRVVYTRFQPAVWTRIPLPGKLRGLGHFAWPDPDHSVWLPLGGAGAVVPGREFRRRLFDDEDEH